MKHLLPNVKLDHDYNRYYSINQDDIIIDLGATIGEYTIENYDEIINKNAFILMVEPCADAIITMQQWMEKVHFTNGCLLSTGVWPEVCYKELTRTDNIWCNSMQPELKQNDFPIRYHQKVMALDLDYIIKSFNKRIGLLKADIEGAELDVLINSKCLDLVDNLAIAAYHIVNGEMTHVALEKHLKGLGFNVIVDNTPYNGFPHYEMVYASREPLKLSKGR